jgi:F420-dependent methylenetetrahydromethanopterin dehydrogenase
MTQYVIDYITINLRTKRMVVSADFDGRAGRERVGVELLDDGIRTDGEIIPAFRKAQRCDPDDDVIIVSPDPVDAGNI